MKWLLSFVAVVALAGCAAPMPFNTVSLGGEPTVTSKKDATLTLVTGAVGTENGSLLIPAGNVLVPISTGPTPKLQFNAQDQTEFMSVLRSELLRLKVFPTVEVGATPTRENFKITVFFTHTRHHSASQEYMLDVVMDIEGGKIPFKKQYQAYSHEKASWWDHGFTNAYEGKVLAVRRLLEKLVPDIQAYVDQNT